jgi:hypothetical protein
MKREKDLKSAGRRDFFKKAGAGLGVAGAAAVGLGSGTAAAEVKPDRGSRNGGYRETEHVKRAYELSRF